MSKFTVKKSDIHGKGLFSNEAFKKGSYLGKVKFVPATVEGPHNFNWTDLCIVDFICHFKYLNHSLEPNARIKTDEKGLLIKVMALKPIKEGDEITIHYGEDWEGV